MKTFLKIVFLILICALIAFLYIVERGIAVLILTILTEVFVARRFKFGKKQIISGIILINLITNPLLTFSLKLFETSNFFILLFFEVLIIELEYFLLIYILPKTNLKSLLKLSIIMNISSVFIGALFHSCLIHLLDGF